MAADTHRRFYLITYPRTASNLLLRILDLEKQSKFLSPKLHGGYFFMSSFLVSRELRMRESNCENWTQEERCRLMQAYQDSFRNFEEFLKQAEAEDKIAFVKEHALFLTEPSAQAKALFGEDGIKEPPWTVQYSNGHKTELTHTALNTTVLPDEFLRTWLPIFLIRHPAAAFPSLCRAIQDSHGKDSPGATEEQLRVSMNIKWTRSLYEFYADKQGASSTESHNNMKWPLVLDADDVIGHQDVLIHLCELLGIDKDKLQFSWEQAEDKFEDARAKRFLSTISNSEGILKEKLANEIDIDAEAKKWKVEFGEQIGSAIEEHVRDSMPDYEFLKSKRLRPRVL